MSEHVIKPRRPKDTATIQESLKKSGAPGLYFLDRILGYVLRHDGAGVLHVMNTWRGEYRVVNVGKYCGD